MDIIWAFEQLMVRERRVRRESWLHGKGYFDRNVNIYWDWKESKLWYDDGTTRPDSEFEMSNDDLLATDWVEWVE